MCGPSLSAAFRPKGPHCGNLDKSRRKVRHAKHGRVDALIHGTRKVAEETAQGRGCKACKPP